MSKRELTDNELSVLIAESFNVLPEADPRRLNSVLIKLDKRRTKHRHLIWWSGIFIAAAAAASGYIYKEWDKLFSNEPITPRVISIGESHHNIPDNIPSEPPGTMDQPDPKPVEGEQLNSGSRQSPRVIYSR